MAYYPVKLKGADKPRVIKARTPAAALRHATADTFTVGPPMNNDELVDAMRGGTVVEEAGEAAEADGDAKG